MADENKNEAGHSNVSIQWDDTNMESIYANVATATLLFGTHKNWRGTQPENGEVDVSLSKRIVMSPYAAKRMAAILNQSLEVYEKQFGKIGV